jgi:DNA invertase Pin-like site-specific DNA recombinase
MLKDAGRRKFDVVMAWAIDRLGQRILLGLMFRGIERVHQLDTRRQAEAAGRR